MEETQPQESPRRRGRPSKRVRGWVEHYVRRETLLSGGGSVALLLFGLFTLYLTFWIWYGVLWFIAPTLVGWWIPVTYSGILITAGAIVVLLFVAHYTADREELEHLEFETGPGVTVAVNVLRAVGYGHLSVALGPKYARSYVKVLSVICLIAPQSLDASWQLAQRARRTRRIDVDGCARVLAMLHEAGGKVTLGQLGRGLPGIDWETMLPLLRDMNGVVFLFQEHPGLTMAEHLKNEIAAFEG